MLKQTRSCLRAAILSLRPGYEALEMRLVEFARLAISDLWCC